MLSGINDVRQWRNRVDRWEPTAVQGPGGFCLAAKAKRLAVKRRRGSHVFLAFPFTGGLVRAARVWAVHLRFDE